MPCVLDTCRFMGVPKIEDKRLMSSSRRDAASGRCEQSEGSPGDLRPVQVSLPSVVHTVQSGVLWRMT
jgi:hypothetical protein